MFEICLFGLQVCNILVYYLTLLLYSSIVSVSNEFNSAMIDTSLKDGLFHEYKKHGKVTMVKVIGQGTDRYAVVCFKK